MDKCICNDDLLHGVKCVMCHYYFLEKMYPYERKEKCKIHHIKDVTICGRGEYVCKSCKDKGWYSTAGSGGGIYHENYITKTSKPIKDKI